MTEHCAHLTAQTFSRILGMLDGEDCQSWPLALNTLCSMRWQSFPCIMDWVLLTYRTHIRDCVCGMKACESSPLIIFLLSKNLLRAVRTTGQEGSGEWELDLTETYVRTRFPFRKLSQDEADSCRDVIRLVIRRIINEAMLLPLDTAGFSVRSSDGINPLVPYTVSLSLDPFIDFIIDTTCHKNETQTQIEIALKTTQTDADERK